MSLKSVPRDVSQLLVLKGGQHILLPRLAKDDALQSQVFLAQEETDAACMEYPHPWRYAWQTLMLDLRERLRKVLY